MWRVPIRGRIYDLNSALTPMVSLAGGLPGQAITRGHGSPLGSPPTSFPDEPTSDSGARLQSLRDISKELELLSDQALEDTYDGRSVVAQHLRHAVQYINLAMDIQAPTGWSRPHTGVNPRRSQGEADDKHIGEAIGRENNQV